MSRVRRDRAREEFEGFVAGSTEQLIRTAYLVVWDLPAAEDLVQECLLRVARRWPRVRTMQYPLAYARRVLVNLALDGAERRRRHTAELAAPIAQALKDQLDEAAGSALGAFAESWDLTAALAALAPRQRAALVLRYFEDLSETQVAELMGCSAGTVKSTTSRALQRLRQVLVPAEVDAALRTSSQPPR